MSLEADLQRLLAPIEPDAPAGADLEDTPLLASFDALRVFGNLRAASKDAEPNWRSVRDQANAALAQSKDLRVLAYWSAAALHLDGWPGMATGLEAAAGWLQASFDQIYPRPDGTDATLRKNTLAYFSDRIAMLDALRRAPLVSNRQFGAVSLRDVALAAKELAPAEGEVVPSDEGIAAVFAATPIDELRAVQQAAERMAAALRGISDRMRAFGGAGAVPSLEGVIALVAQAQAILTAQLAAHPGAAPAAEAEAGGAGPGAGGPGGGPIGSGPIRSRQEAIRALEAVAAFFRGNEPSSPVPLFIERAKRLVGKNFLEALEDVAPTALPEARLAGGVKEPGA